MNLNDKIYIAGHRGLLGSVIVKQLESSGLTNLIISKKPTKLCVDTLCIEYYLVVEKV